MSHDHPEYDDLNQRLLPQIESLCNQWLGGQREGKYWVAHNPCYNDTKASLKIDITNGIWRDWGSESDLDKGSDLVSLYARIKNINQSQSYKELTQFTNGTMQHNSFLCQVKINCYYESTL